MQICENCKKSFFSVHFELKYCYNCACRVTVMNTHNDYIMTLEKIYSLAGGNLCIYMSMAKYVVKKHINHASIRKLYI